MSLPENVLPFGLRDCKLTAYSAAGVLGAASTAVDYPAIRTFSFSEAEDFETLRGDDGDVAIRGKGASIEWSLEGGGISFAIWKVLSGGAIVSSGTTPALKKVYTKKVTDVRPYFKVEGQAISDSGGDIHGVVFKCRASESLETEFADGEWALTECGGMGIANSSGDLYEFTQNETAVAIVTA